MARKPNYKRMYNDAMNLLKLKKEALPKKEIKLEVPEDFKQNGIEDLEKLIEEVIGQITYFNDNKGNRLVPPTLQTLYGRLLKVNEDMKKINKTLVKVEIEDYEKAYKNTMIELMTVDHQLKELAESEIEGQQKLEG